MAKSVHPLIPSVVAHLAGTAPFIRDGVRTKPIKNNAGEAKSAILAGMAKRLEQLNVTSPTPIKLNEGIYDISYPQSAKYMGSNEPMYERGLDGKPNPSKFVRDDINYNPNADSATLAHELGHTTSRKTDIGNIVSKLRHNPKLAMAIAVATGIVPTAAAVMTPGDDEYEETMLTNLALTAPVLADEVLATKNGLAIMDNAGLRASLGQRGKLAGGFLSYLAAPLVSASMFTALGNQFDEDIPVV